MTPDQQAELRAAVRENAACAAALAARDCDEIARIMSVGRTCGNDREIGYGTILEVIGLAAGNQLIDFIKSNDDLRNVVPLLEQGRLRIGSLMVQTTLKSFVAAGAVNQANADHLCALGLQPDRLDRAHVIEALFNPDGTEK